MKKLGHITSLFTELLKMRSGLSPVIAAAKAARAASRMAKEAGMSDYDMSIHLTKYAYLDVYFHPCPSPLMLISF